MADDKITGKRGEAVAAYKEILKSVLDKRPSGTRQRLAEALQRNRSFVTQITNSAYQIPVPSQHVAMIFEICHFSAAEKQAFLAAYKQAHPRSPIAVSTRPRTRHLHVSLPDFGSDERNAAFDALLHQFIDGVARLAIDKPKPPRGQINLVADNHPKEDAS